VMSFTSSLGLLPEEVAATRRTYSQQQLGAKVEMVYSLLSMLGTHDREDMSKTLLAMSGSPDSCVAMRQSGRFSWWCITLRISGFQVSGLCSSSRILNTRKQCFGHWICLCPQARGVGRFCLEHLREKVTEVSCF
jgi:hypothetical protein